MKPDISEFSYGFAITKELVDWYGKSLTAAPLFPSLIQEGKIGYDVKLNTFGFPIFLQFKTSDYMKNSNATEVYKQVLRPPFHRMYLRSRRYSNQHNLLLQLENQGNLVYYVAPSFYTQYSFNNYYVNNQVAINSVFIKPTSIGVINDDDNHFISWKPSNKIAWRFSTPIQIQQSIDFANFTNEVISKSREMINAEMNLRNNLRQLAQRINNIILENELFRSQIFGEDYNFLLSESIWYESPEIVLQQLDTLSRVFFDLQILIVNEVNL
jgi:hypothetical protein